MNFYKLILAFCGLVLLVGCGDSSAHDVDTTELKKLARKTREYQGMVSRKDILKLKLGANSQEVADQLKPAKPTVGSVPCLIYNAKEGGYYYLQFYNLALATTLSISEQDWLQLVVYYKAENPGKGEYILPSNKRGKAFKFSDLNKVFKN